jgi:hypothetical protein
LRDPGFAGGKSVSVEVAADNEIGSGRTDALDFFRGGRGWKKDLGWDAKLACCVSDRYPVIAAGSGNNAGLGNFAGKKISESAASLEGASVLEKFQFEGEADRIQTKIGGRDFEDRRAAYVRANESFDFNNAGVIDKVGDRACCGHGDYSR